MVVTGTKDRTFLVSYVQKTSLVFMFIFKVHLYIRCLYCKDENWSYWRRKSSYVDTAYSSKLFKTTPLFKVSGWHFMVGYSRVYIVINFSLSISPFKFNTFATFKLKMWWYEIASTLNKKKNIKYTNEIEKTTENKIRWNLVLKIYFFSSEPKYFGQHF